MSLPGEKFIPTVVYRRYASLFFICQIGDQDNELVTLEIIHRYVEILDQFFGNVCELDLIFNFQQAYAVLDELIISGEMQETSKTTPLRMVPDLIFLTFLTLFRSQAQKCRRMTKRDSNFWRKQSYFNRDAVAQ